MQLPIVEIGHPASNAAEKECSIELNREPGHCAEL